MHEHWLRKRKRSRMDLERRRSTAGTSLGMEATARSAASSPGAGAGGFLLFYAPDPKPVRAAMAEAGLTELRFAFDHDGSSLIVRD